MAPIPNAIISIRCDSGGAQELRTDNVGEATISLDPGLHFISVSAPGFESWKSSVEMKANANRSIRAELKIGAMCSPCVTVADDSSQVELERRSLDVEFLLLPLEALPLPAHKLRLSRPHPRTT